MRSLVISIFLYACESWTLTAELEKRTQAFEMRCYWTLLNISYKDHVTSEEVRRKTQVAIAEYEELLTPIEKRKLRWFGHVSRSSGLDNPTRRSERKKEKEADRRRVGKRISVSKSGQEWSLPAQLVQLKPGQDGRGLLRVYLWCPDDLPSHGIEQNRMPKKM